MSEEEKKGRSRKQPKEEPQETSLGKEILSWLQIDCCCGGDRFCFK